MKGLFTGRRRKARSLAKETVQSVNYASWMSKSKRTKIQLSGLNFMKLKL